MCDVINTVMMIFFCFVMKCINMKVILDLCAAIQKFRDGFDCK